MAWPDALLAAFQTLTRLPVPSPGRAPDQTALGRSGVFYPLVGAVLGLAAWGCYWGAAQFLPTGLAAAFALLTVTLLSGALHEDGLADTADAFGSQRTAQDRFRVMKDSRIGTYGGVALVFAYLLRWQALAASVNPGEALYVALVLSRTAAVGLAFVAGPAGEGLGGAFARAVRPGHVAGAAFLAAALTAPWFSLPTAVGAAASLAALGLAAPYFRQRIGGVTGDGLGALVVVSEVLVLTSYAALGAS